MKNNSCFCRIDSMELYSILVWLYKSHPEMGVDIFDAFLHGYKETGDIEEAIDFAVCEWDYVYPDKTDAETAEIHMDRFKIKE